MPKIYLSPSTQENNLYVTGGSEEYYMNLVADALEPYLRASGIRFTRNRPEMTAGQVIRESNAGNYNLHLALHSNAAPIYGTLQEVDVYHFPGSINGTRAAEILADNFRVIYPDPALVDTRATTALGEVDRVRAPAVLIEIAYHDNAEDANWIINNIGLIARTIALSLTEYFDLPFVEPLQPFSAEVNTESGRGLNLRDRPSVRSAVLGSIPDGAGVTVYGLLPEWAAVEYRGLGGFVRREYLDFD